MASRIEDYAMIGDFHTAALVGKDGSIDWFCLPRFDSGACFAALLGTPEHGRWLIAPAKPAKQTKRRYRENSLILETDFETEDGCVTVVDFMPPREKHPRLIRLVRGVRGRVNMRMELIFRYDYGKLVPWVSRSSDGALHAVAGPNEATLRSSVDIRGEDLMTVSEFAVKKGKTASFVLGYSASHLPAPEALDPEKALAKTEAFWNRWGRGCAYKGPYEAAVRRSLITLKGLTYWPTGGITAAATTSLPEQLGGERNWDYRYCWLRDASHTLQVLRDAAYHEEAEDWRDWMVRAAAGSPDLVQIMYGLAGERFLNEWEVDWLPGYEGSKPVRVGNAAVKQLQLDVYGEMAGVMYHARKGKISEHDHGIELECSLLDTLKKSGANRIKEFGRCEDRVANLPTRRSWRGTRSIARSRVAKSSGSKDQWLAGELFKTKFMKMCAAMDLILLCAVSFNRMDRTTWTPASSRFRRSDFFLRPMRACKGRFKRSSAAYSETVSFSAMTLKRRMTVCLRARVFSYRVASGSRTRMLCRGECKTRGSFSRDS